MRAPVPVRASEMPTLEHVHGRACDNEIFSMWERFFLPLVDPQILDSRNPLLRWPVHQYFMQLVAPQIRCSRLRAWLLVYLAAPGINRRTTVRHGQQMILDMAENLQEWWNTGRLTNRWAAVGAPAIRLFAQERGLHFLHLD